MKDEPACDEFDTKDDALQTDKGQLIEATPSWLLSSIGSVVWAVIESDALVVSKTNNDPVWLRRAFLIVRATTGNKSPGPWNGNCKTHDLELLQLGEQETERFCSPVNPTKRTYGKGYHWDGWGGPDVTGLDWWACQRRAGQWPLNDWHNAYIRFYRQK